MVPVLIPSKILTPPWLGIKGNEKFSAYHWVMLNASWLSRRKFSISLKYQVGGVSQTLSLDNTDSVVEQPVFDGDRREG